MFLRRSDADPATLIFDQNGALVNAENLEFDHQVVPRVHLIYEMANCWGVEFGYFGIESWNVTEGGHQTITPILTYPGFVLPSTAPGAVFNVSYGTDLHNGEANLRRRINEFTTLLGGFRWIELRDEFRAFATQPTPTEMYSIDTNNHLYGFQMGADSELVRRQGVFHVDALARVGVMFNRADQATQAPSLTTLPGVVDNITARDDNVAFISEVGLRAVLDLPCGFSAYGGYHVMVLDGISLAPDQIAASDLTGLGSATLDTGGTLLFHGATVGLMARF